MFWLFVIVVMLFAIFRPGMQNAWGADNVVTIDNNAAVVASLPTDPWDKAVCDDFNVETGAGRQLPGQMLQDVDRSMAAGRCESSACWSDRALFAWVVTAEKENADYRVYRVQVFKNLKPWWTATKKVCRP